MERATIVPLDYGGGRVENSVLYFSDEWDGLKDLLVDPVDRVAQLERSFGQHIGDKHPFKLESPTTVVLDHVLSRFEFLAQMAGFLSIDIPLSESKIDALAHRLRDRFPGGCFLLEFAIETHIVRIRYLPPQPANLGNPHFKDPIMQPTLALVEGTTLGDLHFDIKGDPTRRAELVMDFIEDRMRIAELVNAKQPKALAHASLASSGDTIDRVMPPAADGTWALRVDPNVLYPGVVIEGASVPIPDCTVCIDLAIRTVGTDYNMGSALFKLYCPPL